MSDKTVRVFDFETKQLTTIPAAELAPGMVQARVQGIGTVYISAGQAVKLQGFRHPPMPEMRENFAKIKASLDEVFPMSLEQWENGFRRDTNPEREIAFWLF